MPRTLLHVFPTFAVGGAQLRFVALANHFGPAYRHIVVALDGNDLCRARLRPDVDAVFPSVPAIKGDVIGAAHRARRMLRDLRPDLLVTSNWGSIDWAIGNFGPIAPHVHLEDGFGPEEQSSQLPRRVWTRRLALRRSLVVLPSQTLLRLATGTWRLPPGRLRCIPNGVDVARFGPGPRPPHSPDEGQVIGTIAALRAEKNLARLLHAFRELLDRAAGTAAPPRLIVVGDGPERAALEQLAHRLGIDRAVRFAGHADDPAMAYRDFDVFALSSDTEQMPLSLLEAMAAGLPAAATDVGDVRTMLSAANAPFVAARNASDLADALHRLLRRPDDARAVGAANRAKAERDFDQATMFRAYRAIFDGPGQPPEDARAIPALAIT